MSIQFTSISHVSIIISNLEKSEKFYSDFLGLKPIRRPNFEFPGIWYSLGGKAELHLILCEPMTHRWKAPKSLDLIYPHLALAVKDTEQALKKLKKSKYRFFKFESSPTQSRQLFVLDPDRNMIEFIGPFTKKTQKIKK